MTNQPLTQAQARHLRTLIALRAKAEQDVALFAQYLYDEYGLDPSQYGHIDDQVGFVFTGQAEEPCDLTEAE